MVAAGGRHSLFLSEEGRVYACGAASDGQLGLAQDAKTPMQADVDQPTVRMFVGMHAMFVFTKARARPRFENTDKTLILTDLPCMCVFIY